MIALAKIVALLIGMIICSGSIYGCYHATTDSASKGCGVGVGIGAFILFAVVASFEPSHAVKKKSEG